MAHKQTPERTLGVIYRIDEAVLPNRGGLVAGACKSIKLAVVAGEVGAVGQMLSQDTYQRLADVGMDGFLNKRITGHDLSPEDQYFAMSSHLGFDAQRLAVVETTPAGVKAAREIGYRVVGLAVSHSAQELFKAHAHKVCQEYGAVDYYLHEMMGTLAYLGR